MLMINQLSPTCDYYSHSASRSVDHMHMQAMPTPGGSGVLKCSVELALILTHLMSHDIVIRLTHVLNQQSSMWPYKLYM